MSKLITGKVMTKLAKQMLRGAGGRRVVNAFAGAALDQCLDTVRLIRGDISQREFSGRTAANVLGVGGSVGGSVGGAAIGTLILPGIGTAVGSFVGGMLGGSGARAAGRAIFG
jgi:hypothetical protein